MRVEYNHYSQIQRNVQFQRLPLVVILTKRWIFIPDVVLLYAFGSLTRSFDCVQAVAAFLQCMQTCSLQLSLLKHGPLDHVCPKTQNYLTISRTLIEDYNTLI